MPRPLPPPALPKAVHPTREPTLTASPAPPQRGSYAPEKRSYSPPPVELAPDPQSVREARREAREKVAESERREPEKSTLESLAEIPGIRRGVSVIWRWVLPFVLAALATVGGWVFGYAKGLAAAYERMAAIEEKQRLGLERLKKVETAVEAIGDGQAAELASMKSMLGTEARKREQLVGEVEDLKKAVPKIEGLKPSP